ncbi:hypothetical protein FOPG_03968 [Fusarium oxysporum f. sp. conglutinans race 2 54008]|uniref:Uncharacterized protein n=3 Tax=Fusarium oxysporum TaxID=5507 RepID=X0MD47_FUSOX|nr:hypothetical protein FOVG_10402 [Fusarium oxysporum f. sp. pisi HDV247]EXL83432.1 hypothetical protein FOPG_03968 [Fusarium oxysporum f. sp. conglutinans race 2 54008]EXM31442.1 hypothetical protein FOTG_04148 [Fusarium oxysporum f. sp. vasinfectum 25433]
MDTNDFVSLSICTKPRLRIGLVFDASGDYSVAKWLS